MNATDDDQRDQRLYDEISRITNDYGALHRRTVRDLARTRVELAKAQAVLGTVAHDLRSPLTAVLGFTELLLADQELTAAQRELGERVNRAALSMASLTDELVEAATVGSSPLLAERVDLSFVVGHVVTRHQLLHPPGGVQVVIDQDLIRDAPSIIDGDEAKLERLLDNLISNAVKFSPDGGSVRVSVINDGHQAVLRVRDEGPGLAAEELSRIFEPFHRAPDAAAIPGVGLGLTIVKQITERHGGHVHAESVPGAGATFVVRLPLSARARSTQTLGHSGN